MSEFDNHDEARNIEEARRNYVNARTAFFTAPLMVIMRGNDNAKERYDILQQDVYNTWLGMWASVRDTLHGLYEAVGEIKPFEK